jgi:predicted P-loop ATPase
MPTKEEQELTELLAEADREAAQAWKVYGDEPEPKRESSTPQLVKVTDPKKLNGHKILDAIPMNIEEIGPKPKAQLPVVAMPNPFALVDRGFNVPLLEKTIAAMRSLQLEYKYDRLRDRYHVGDHVITQSYGESVDAAILVLRTKIMQTYNFECRKENSRDAVVRLCLENSFHPVLDYLNGLKWDGKPRVDKWMTTYFGAADTPLNNAFGRKVLVAAVRRMRVPGTKFDQMLVLESKQGAGKSSAIQILAGEEFFTDAEVIGRGSKEAQEQCRGKWLYEIAELEGMHKSDASVIKAFISRTHDRCRPAFGRERVDMGRTCIFIGTCNRNDYLVDDTGNRRFWPVVVADELDLYGLQRDRDQLWAEACVIEATPGETLVLDKALWVEAAQQAEERFNVHPWEDELRTLDIKGTVPGQCSREQGEIRVSSNFCLKIKIGINPASQKNNDSKVLSGIMRRLGWNGPKVLKIGGQDARGYWRSE